MAFTTEHGYAESSQHLLGIPRKAIYPFYTMEDFIYIIEQKIEYSHQARFHSFYVH